MRRNITNHRGDKVMEHKIKYIEKQLQMRNEIILHALESYMETVDFMLDDNIPDIVKRMRLRSVKEEWQPIADDIIKKIKKNT